MPINKFYVIFATSFGPFKPTKVIKRNQKYEHRFPQFNFEILTNVTSGYLDPTLPIGPGTVLSFSGRPARGRSFIWHDAYPHTTGCVSTSQPQEPLNIGMYLVRGPESTFEHHIR